MGIHFHFLPIYCNVTQNVKKKTNMIFFYSKENVYYDLFVIVRPILIEPVFTVYCPGSHVAGTWPTVEHLATTTKL